MRIQFSNSKGRHCEERSDEAIQLSSRRKLDCFAALAMTLRDTTPHSRGVIARAALLCWLRNHLSVANLVSNCFLVAAFCGVFRLQPGLGHGAFDNVTLYPLALRASERSQVLAGIARLNRRQFHGRTASRALRTLVLRIEHGIALSSVP
jgi:hypothetical protein